MLHCNCNMQKLQVHLNYFKKIYVISSNLTQMEGREVIVNR